jgi:tRNA threonylcarbamoyladenosine biosynthesis protein TsaE
VTRTLVSRGEADTAAAGEALGARLGPGSVVLLTGELGAGKTAFVRGLAAGLGIRPEEVSSPTFTLVQEYRGRPSLYHVDLYRISSLEAEELGLDDLRELGVVAIEWADRLEERPAGAVEVVLEDLGGDTRRLTIQGHPEDAR